MMEINDGDEYNIEISKMSNKKSPYAWWNSIDTPMWNLNIEMCTYRSHIGYSTLAVSKLFNQFDTDFDPLKTTKIDFSFVL